MVVAFISSAIVIYLGIMINILYRLRDPFTVRFVRKFTRQKEYTS